MAGLFRRRLWTLLLCALLLISAAGCKKNQPPESPEAYAIGADIAPTLDSLLAQSGEGELTAIALLDGEGQPVEESAPPEESHDPESTETSTPTAVSQYVYTYDKLAAGGASAQSYAELLALEENGYVTVGEDGKPTDPPDYAATEGTVILAKDSKTEGSLIQIRLDWTETGCTVTVTSPEGSLKPPAEEQGMTVSEAVVFLESQGTDKLGLPGESMADYEVYPREGLVMADDNACIQLAVYQKTEVGTNSVEGIYLVTGDKTHIYRLNKDQGSIVELTATPA